MDYRDHGEVEMSVTALPATSTVPSVGAAVASAAATSASAPSPRRLSAKLQVLHSVITRVATTVEAPDAPVVTAASVAEVDRAIRRLEAVKLALIARADAELTHRSSGATSTSAWVSTITHTGGGLAAGQVSLATALQDGLPTTRHALSEGAISVTSAGIIADTVSKLPETLTSAEKESVEASLVKEATRLHPGQLRKSATSALAAAGKAAQDAAEHQEQVLLDRERRAYAAAVITMHDRPDGTTVGRFTVPTGAAHVLRKILHSMTSPRRDHLRKASEHLLADGQTCAGDLDDGSVAATLAESIAEGAEGQSVNEGRNSDWASLDWSQRRGRAFAELLEHLPTDKLTGKVASTVVVTMTVDQIGAAADLAVGTSPESAALWGKTPGVGAVRCDTGHQHSTSEARRLACNAGILPLVLGGPGLPVDLGRQERFFTDPQRTALGAIYEQCAAAGCDRPFAWSELHHEQPWSRGGRTDIDDALPVCGHHHRLLHDPAYRHTRTRDPGTGRKVVTFHARM